MIHFYCLVVEAGFYSDVVECLPVDPATWVRFPAGAGKIFSLYDINQRCYPGSEFVVANTLAKRKSCSQMKLTLAKVLARK